MNPLEDIFIEGLLRIDDKGIVYQKEDTKVEFKEKFDRESKEARAKYTKELAAMHNCEGGYLIFGVDDKTNELKGLNDFKDVDNAIITDDINSYFSPHFKIISRHIKIHGKVVFVIYVFKREGIPTVCIKGHQDAGIKEATIYWRYSGQSSPIEAGDLINLLHSLRGEEVGELVAVKKTELKLQYKPDLRSNGGQSGLDKVKLTLDNHGATAKILELLVLEGNVNAAPFGSLPRLVRKGESFVFQVSTSDGSVANSKQFALQINFQDEMETKYAIIGKYTGASGKFGEAKEV
ncbi:MAG: ATP-binding protein [Bacteroidetes bacterium]|nr:ATP-binding protein [Bacteroidota bacterium]